MLVFGEVISYYVTLMLTIAGWLSGKDLGCVTVPELALRYSAETGY